jgi:tetratricopeptide (TPR) repeat protein
LHAASLATDPDQKIKIYNSFSKIFPNDWRGPNNAGMVLASLMKYAEARPYFEKAEKLKPEEPIIKNNLGTIALFENDIRKAEEYFGAASGSGNEVNYNLGLVNIRKGDYNRANQYFRSYADPNTALVKILSGNYNGALSDLEDFDRPNCYMKEYLKAIVGARTGKEDLLIESLKKAVAYNADIKAKATTEMEFAKYFENPRFREIVK